MGGHTYPIHSVIHQCLPFSPKLVICHSSSDDSFSSNVCVETQVCLPRLRELLEAEEKQYLQEIEAKKETSLQRQEKMKEYIKALRERREKERQQLVSDKLEQLFR